MDEDIYQELKMLALKEKMPVKNIIIQQLNEYVKEHKDGNPQFTLEQFKDPNFIACPAFYRSGNVWDCYCKNQEESELIKLKNQILLIEKQVVRYL